MSLHFMHGIDLRKLSPQAVLALMVANDCYAEEGEHCVVTSVCRPGTFLEAGYHGTGNAVDLSCRRLDGKPIPDETMDEIYRQINLRIGRVDGGQYDVIYEKNPGSSAGWTGPHIHIEYDPK